MIDKVLTLLYLQNMDSSEKNQPNYNPDKEPNPISEDNLFTVSRSPDGEGYSVMIPMVIDTAGEKAASISTRTYPTKEQAQSVARKEQKYYELSIDEISLKKTFGRFCNRIDRTKRGNFRVRVPGIRDSKTGHFLGVKSVSFDTWDDAKKYYLENREKHEQLSTHPLLQLEVADGVRLSFSSLDAFNPREAPSATPSTIPEEISRLFSALDTKSQRTYRKTTSEPGWQSKLFSFISSYLEGEGSSLAKKIGISQINILTPRQAVELSTNIVIELTKYYESGDESERQEHSGSEEGNKAYEPKLSQADKSSVLQILQEGRARKHDPNWKGNGVCRNFADSVKAVFEALKAHQSRYNLLSATYCFYSTSDIFEPRRKSTRILSIKNTGHAWNTFVTISKGKANATVVDATWAKEDLETGKVEDIDYTLTRMEPAVYDAVNNTIGSKSPLKDLQIKQVLEYYSIRMDTPDKYGIVSAEDAAEYFATRALSLIGKMDEPGNIPPQLRDTIFSVFKELENISKPELETLHRIARSQPDVVNRSLISSIVTRYLQNKNMEYHGDRAKLIVADNDLQRAIFSTLVNPRFREQILQFPETRARYREIFPGTFPPFSPTTNPLDKDELQYLFARTNIALPNPIKVRLNQPTASDELVTELFRLIREKMQKINPDTYQATIANWTDYEVIRKYSQALKILST